MSTLGSHHTTKTFESENYVFHISFNCRGHIVCLNSMLNVWASFERKIDSESFLQFAESHVFCKYFHDRRIAIFVWDRIRWEVVFAGSCNMRAGDAKYRNHAFNPNLRQPCAKENNIIIFKVLGVFLYFVIFLSRVNKTSVNWLIIIDCILLRTIETAAV